MKTNEKRFWERLLTDVNPGWAITINEGGGGAPFSNQKVCVYVVDSSNLWMRAGATTTAEMLDGARRLDRDKELADMAIAAAGSSTVAASSGQTDASLCAEVPRLALMALTRMRTYKIVQEQFGDVAGHWLYLVYRMKDGSFISRPAFLRPPAAGGGFLPLEAVVSATQQLVALDHKSVSSEVGRKIRACGGAYVYGALLSS